MDDGIFMLLYVDSRLKEQQSCIDPQPRKRTHKTAHPAIHENKRPDTTQKVQEKGRRKKRYVPVLETQCGRVGGKGMKLEYPHGNSDKGQEKKGLGLFCFLYSYHVVLRVMVLRMFSFRWFCVFLARSSGVTSISISLGL